MKLVKNINPYKYSNSAQNIGILSYCSLVAVSHSQTVFGSTFQNNYFFRSRQIFNIIIIIIQLLLLYTKIYNTITLLSPLNLSTP